MLEFRYALFSGLTSALDLRLHILILAQNRWRQFPLIVCDLFMLILVVQGRLALEEHFKNSRFACDTDDYLPLIFRPPRNGKNSSLPATVATVHQSSRVLSTSLEEYEKGSHNGEKREDERPNRVFTKGVICASQDSEIDLSTAHSRCALGGQG